MPSTAKFEVRVTPEFKEDLLLAAEASGMSLTEFAIRNLRPCIDKVLQREREWQLQEEESLRLLEALRSDSDPNEALQAAAKRYKASGLGE
jgi:uncharacterized protein (DUF1778 family)